MIISCSQKNVEDLTRDEDQSAPYGNKQLWLGPKRYLSLAAFEIYGDLLKRDYRIPNVQGGVVCWVPFLVTCPLVLRCLDVYIFLQAPLRQLDLLTFRETFCAVDATFDESTIISDGGSFSSKIKRHFYTLVARANTLSWETLPFAMLFIARGILLHLHRDGFPFSCTAPAAVQ